MSKRASLEEQDEPVPVEKKAKLADGDQDLDQEAEWAAFQALIGESGANGAAEQQEKANIELADDDGSATDEENNEEVTGAWDEDDMNVEKRLENQEARKKYLEQLRAQRDANKETNQALQDNKTSAVDTGTDEDKDSSGVDEEEDDDDDDDDGWIK